MEKIFPLIILAAILFNCTDENSVEQPCSTPATVRDFTGLDGCGFVLELESGKILIPLRIGYCGTPPLPKEITEDPLYDFDWEDGKRVMIDYTIEDMANICMTGQVAKINCISNYIIYPSEE